MKWCTPLILFLAVPSLALAQEVTGDLEGRIVDDQGAPIALVNITVTGPNLLGPRGSISNTAGDFRVLALPVGEYTVQIKHISYREASIEHVRIALGKTTTLGEIRLDLQAIPMEAVVVRGRQLTDPMSTEIGANLSEELLDTLPTERDYREVIAYLPQANASFYGDPVNVGGATGTENSFMIDGVNVTDPFFADTSIQLPQNFIREIELKTGGYQAEFGRATGGIVNVVTHSGTDEFEGSVFAFVTNNDFASERRRGLFELSQRSYSRYDIGLSLGGPILEEKLRFFVAYNPRFAIEDLVLPGGSVHRDEKVAHQFATKLSWQLGANTLVEVTGFGDPSQHDRVGVNSVGPLLPASLANPDPFLGDWKVGGTAVSVRGKHLIGDRAVLLAEVSRSRQNRKADAATERGAAEPQFSDRETGEMSGGYGFTFNHQGTRTAGRVKATIFAGRHEVKAGLEYEDVVLDDEWYFLTSSGAPGLLSRSPISETEVQWQSILLDLDHEVGHRIPSVFVQDSWRITDRLRINAGLRWDGLYIVDDTGVVADEIDDQYQPRVGFVYHTSDEGDQKFFGSFGRFYEEMPLVLTSLFFGDFTQFLVVNDCDPRECSPAVADTLPLGGSAVNFRPRDDLKGPHHDEFVLGYERRLGDRFRLGLRGIHRKLRETVEDTRDFPGPLTGIIVGNPGRGVMAHLPKPKREYSALELTLERPRGGRVMGGLSYVLSRNYGNYPGSFASDQGFFPHRSTNFNDVRQYVDAEGLLPNDRPHVFKLYGSYRPIEHLTLGGFLTWQSGVPISEYGLMNLPLATPVHMRPRGTYGRTPSIWDLNLRLAYELPFAQTLGRGLRSRLLIDVFHLFSQRKVTAVEDLRFVAVDPDTREGLVENQRFGQALAFQPPTTVRIGLETSF